MNKPTHKCGPISIWQVSKHFVAIIEDEVIPTMYGYLQATPSQAIDSLLNTMKEVGLMTCSGNQHKRFFVVLDLVVKMSENVESYEVK